MARSKSIDFSGLDDLLKKLEELGESTHDIVESSLMETAQRTTANLSAVLGADSSYPAGGRYRTGETASRVRQPEMVWKTQDTGYVRWGLDTSDGYKVPYYVINGNEHYRGSSKIARAIASAMIRKDFEVDLEEALKKAVEDHAG